MRRLTQRNHRIPSLIVKSLRKGQVMSSQIKRLLHIRKS
jgi:hypothetical protein